MPGRHSTTHTADSATPVQPSGRRRCAQVLPRHLPCMHEPRRPQASGRTVKRHAHKCCHCTCQSAGPGWVPMHAVHGWACALIGTAHECRSAVAICRTECEPLRVWWRMLGPCSGLPRPHDAACWAERRCGPGAQAGQGGMRVRVCMHVGTAAGLGRLCTRRACAARRWCRGLLTPSQPVTRMCAPGLAHLTHMPLPMRPAGGHAMHGHGIPAGSCDTLCWPMA